MNKFHFYHIKKYMKRLAFSASAAFLLAGVLPVYSPANALPSTVQAAQKPAFTTKRTSLYENGSGEGTYTYTVKNLKKGYKVKWKLTGEGASYVTLKKSSTTATGTKASNKVTVDTLGSQAAKNKKAILTARIYDKKGTLITKVSDSFKIKVNSTYVQIKTGKITSSLDSLSLGSSYDFDCTVSPANATSQLYWKVVSLSGTDYSSQITSSGLWTPGTEGSYYIQAYTKNSSTGAIVSSDQIKVTVGSSLMEVRQTASDGVTAVFSGNVKNTAVLSDFSISYIAPDASSMSSSTQNSPVSLRELTFSEDGCMAMVKTSSTLIDKAVYQVSYKGQVISTFIASIGTPVSGIILTTEVPAGTSYDLKYALYDSNGIDVTSIYSYWATFDGIISDGYIASNGTIYMETLGEYASVIMTCQNGTESFTVNANILCTAENSSGIRTVITSSSDNPVFGNANTTSDNSFYLGETAYFHFQIYDENRNPMTVSNYYYTSQDPTIFTISTDGQLTGIKAGTAMLSVYCTVNYKQLHYTAAITVLPRRAPSILTLSETNITMSNALEDDYITELTVSAYDQYRNPVSQATATATLQEEDGKAMLATYSRTTGKITIATKGAAPGIYTYTLSLLLNGSRISSSFQVTVLDVPSTGVETWLPELNTLLIDKSSISASSGPLKVDIKLAHYINGIFAGYAPIQSASVRNSQGWYNTDLTVSPSAKARKIYPQGNLVSLTAAYWSSGSAKTADSGTYTVTIVYYTDSAMEKTEQTQSVFVVE